MLQFELLKNHAGMVLIGDYLTLRELHTLVHKVNEDSPMIHDKEGPFLGLAYDIRKAYEQQRRVIDPPEHIPEIGPRFGVEIVWPVLLFQTRLLRRALAWVPHGPGDQALVYALEHTVQTAIEAAFKDLAPMVVSAWQNLDPVQPEADDQLDARGALFCSWPKARRRRDFANLLESFSPLYAFAYEVEVGRGERLLLDPAEIELWRGAEWPDPKW